MENKGELETKQRFTEGYKKALFGLVENNPTLGILKIDEVDPEEFGHTNTLMMHRIEFADHSKISVRCGFGDPKARYARKNLPNLPFLDKKNPKYPFFIAEYRVLKPEVHSSRHLLKQFKKLLSPVLLPNKGPTKPSSLDDLVLGKMFVRKDTGVIPAKVGISDANELTVYIRQPLFLFWDSYLETSSNLGDYMAVWIRSLKGVIPEVDKVAKKWAYK